jgi:hypothetical protein
LTGQKGVDNRIEGHAGARDHVHALQRSREMTQVCSP